MLIEYHAAYTQLSPSTLKALPDPGDDFDIKTGALLSPILRPRVPGTAGSAAVLNHFVSFFKENLPAWKLSFQNSTQKTPISGNGKTPFVNFIATRDPPWTSPGEVGYLTLVAHYDSLIKPEGFIGAIDSAAPCAMMMHVARSLEPALVKKWASMDKAGVKGESYDHYFEEHKGVQIIFLDGEEAFVQWSATDSTYGARALAAEMETSIHPALSTYHNALSSISLFLLLDLLGAPSPNVPSYFKTTHWAYQRLADVATRLASTSKALTSSIDRWFSDADSSEGSYWLGGRIEDDHIPFMARGVDILHMIPSKFPDVWHKITDDGEHLDIPTCKDWAVLVTAFAAEWLDLEGYFDTARMSTKHRRGTSGRTEKIVTSKTEL